MSNFIPFFVVDRPASLRIIRGIKLINGKKLGLMAHANTSDNFKNKFRQFPCTDKPYCEVIGKSCPYNRNLDLCLEGKKFLNQIVKISDSGVFTKDGCLFPSYSDLFNEYEKMGIDYGIMIDYLKDKEKTIASASLALSEYNRKKWSFNLIGVIQGESLKDYLECYVQMKGMGYKHIAVGGLLKKHENSARYVQVRDETFLWQVLKEIRKLDPDGWLFSLGCYAPSRHDRFLELDMFGSDYKGWIFQYKNKYPNAKRGNKSAKISRFLQVRQFINNKVLDKPQVSVRPRSLLILPCSKTKINSNAEIEAINLYDGPFFKLLRKQFRENKMGNIDVNIISAKYGLINSHSKIHTYDHKMNQKRAKELNQKIVSDFSKIINNGHHYQNLFVNLGKKYLVAFEGYEATIPKNKHLSIIVAEGKIGQRMKLMKDWINTMNNEL